MKIKFIKIAIIFLILSSKAFASNLMNAGFELPNTAVRLELSGVTNSWDYAPSAFRCGVIPQNEGSFCPTLAAAEGNQFGYLWCGGDEIAQTINGLVTGVVYNISWAEAARTASGAGGKLWVLMDDETISASHDIPADETWVHTNVYFKATATSHRLRFFHSGAWDKMIFIDKVEVGAPETFPKFTVPGFDIEMENFQNMFYLHYKENIEQTPTYNSGWLPMSFSWVGLEPITGNEKRNFYNSLLTSRKISTNGYVTCNQPYGLAHADGWPFPQWNQSDGWGRHYEISDHHLSQWGVTRSTSASDWTITGASTISVTQEEGWKINLTSAAATIQTPTFYVKNVVVPFFQLHWSTTGIGEGAQPYLEWSTDNPPVFDGTRKVYFETITAEDGDVHTMIPLYTHPLWAENDYLRAVRINFDNAAGTTVNVHNAFTAVDSRHNVNNTTHIKACYDYINLTGNKYFLKSNINQMRLAMKYAIEEFDVEANKCVNTPWIGHDGRTGMGPTVLGRGIGGNYWDLLPFGGKDTLATIYLYHALNILADLEEEINKNPEWEVPSGPNRFDPEYLRNLATELKDNSSQFWSSSAGRFVANIDMNNVSHDFGYTFVNLEAVHYGFANQTQTRSILDWISGKRTVAGDLSQGADIYHWIFGPRSSTIRNTSWYSYVWPNTGGTPYGEQIQDGGAVLGFTYHDLMSRLKTYGPENTWERLKTILDWFADVQENGGYREYYKTHPGNLQGGGTGGGLGMDVEFRSSVLVPQIMFYGFLGYKPNLDGFEINPNLPTNWPSISISRILAQNSLISIFATTNEIKISTEIMKEDLFVFLPHDRWIVKYFDSSDVEISSSTNYVNSSTPKIPLVKNGSARVEFLRVPLLYNFSFEDNGIEITAPGYVADNPINAWSCSTANIGRNTDDGPFFGTGKTPDGHNVCFIQSLGNISQTLTDFETGNLYRISLKANAGNWAGQALANMEVKFDGATIIGPIDVPVVGADEDFRTYSAIIKPENFDCLFEIHQTINDGNYALLVDDIQISKVTSSDALNGSFEDDGTSINLPGYASSNPILGWTLSSENKIGRNTSSAGSFLDNGSVPDGENICFIQNSENISQVISDLDSTKNYAISLHANAQAAGAGQATFKVELGSQTIFDTETISPVGGELPFLFFGTNFLPAATDLELKISQTTANDNNVLLIDDIRFEKMDFPYLANSGFEFNGSEIVFPGCAATNLMDWWTVSSKTEVGRNNSTGPYFDNGIIPEGDNICFIKGQNSIQQKVFGFEADTLYKISVRANAATAGTGSENIEVKLNSSTIISENVAVTGAENSFQTFQAIVTPGAGNFVIEIAQSTANADCILLIDDIIITKLPTPYLENPSFEANGGIIIYPGNEAQNPIDAWTCSSSASVGRNTDYWTSPFMNNGAIPDGLNVAYIQGQGNIKQTVRGFKNGGFYVLSLSVNAREIYSGKAELQVKLGGTTIIVPTEVSAVGGNNPFETFTRFINPGEGDFELEISQTMAGDNTLLIDDIVVTNAIPEGGIVFSILCSVFSIWRKFKY